jgi:hypothetical protein
MSLVDAGIATGAGLTAGSWRVATVIITPAATALATTIVSPDARRTVRDRRGLVGRVA